MNLILSPSKISFFEGDLLFNLENFHPYTCPKQHFFVLLPSLCTLNTTNFLHCLKRATLIIQICFLLTKCQAAFFIPHTKPNL